MTKEQMTPFALELYRNIQRTIMRLKAGGTIAMSRANLKQVTPTPKTMDGAPTGEYAPRTYGVLFEQVIDAVPQFRNFCSL